MANDATETSLEGYRASFDQAMVGHYVGHTGNAAIGVSLQIFILVIVFVASVFTGMGVLVARFAGPTTRTRLTARSIRRFSPPVFMAIGVLAPVGYFAAPSLLAMVKRGP